MTAQAVFAGIEPPPVPRDAGRRVAQRARELRGAGVTCRICALGQAIEEVGAEHGQPTYEWREVHDCAAKRARRG